jgi:hypothetical protein
LEKSIEQRLADMAFVEKQLLDRLNDLSRSEKELETRLNIKQQRKQTDNYSSTTNNRMTVDNKTMRKSENIAATTTTTALNSLDKIWESSQITTLQGGTLRTWSFTNPAVKRVHVLLRTDGRPLNADLELWQGPNNTPYTIKVFVQDGGDDRTFSTFIDTPFQPNTICIRNTGPTECPIHGCVGYEHNDDSTTGSVSNECYEVIDRTIGETIQGGALRTYAFEPIVDSVVVQIKTYGLPLNTRIEVIQGSNNIKQVLTVYTEDGMIRPFVAIIQTPGTRTGSVIRVVNTASLEYPIHATVAEHEIGNYDSDDVYAYDDFTTHSGYDTDGLRVFGDW